MKRQLVFERHYPHPPERVWRALTESDLLGRWLMDNDIQPVVGHRFQFRTHSAWGFDGVVDCEVIVADEPHQLAYTWQGGPMKSPTVVTWTLTPTETGTNLTLEHQGFEELSGLAISVILARGWRRHLRTSLPQLLDTMLDSTRQ